jgi:hypothetical protein
VELVAGTIGTAQAQAVQFQDALEVGEQHFDLLPLSARHKIGVGCRGIAGHVARALVDLTRNLAGGRIWRSGLIGPIWISSFIVRLLRLKESEGSASGCGRSIRWGGRWTALRRR